MFSTAPLIVLFGVMVVSAECHHHHDVISFGAACAVKCKSDKLVLEVNTGCLLQYNAALAGV